MYSTIKKAPTAIMAMSAALYSVQTTLNNFLLCFSFFSFTPLSFSCSLRADSASSILVISAAASSSPRCVYTFIVVIGSDPDVLAAGKISETQRSIWPLRF